jgi:hypothetical protein
LSLFLCLLLWSRLDRYLPSILDLCLLLTQNQHPASSTQQAEQASFTREKIPKRASQFSLKINKKTK